MGNIGNKFFLSEDERKYKFDVIEKNTLFTKEVLVFQWYDPKDVELETKLIFRLLNCTFSWCRIRKKRTSEVHADKTIEYITEPDLNSLVGSPFLCKRRSVIGNIYVDKFIVSNGVCENMLENEGDQDELKSFVEKYQVKGLLEVTSDYQYHSRDMAVPFRMNHLIELQLLFKNFPKQDK